MTITAVARTKARSPLLLVGAALAIVGGGMIVGLAVAVIVRSEFSR
ncbi:hypothetical protein [Nonomuraea turkmeniaca]|nr:hypothetical protein [Nonomuraea turkmeniaca]